MHKEIYYYFTIYCRYALCTKKYTIILQYIAAMPYAHKKYTIILQYVAAENMLLLYKV